MFPSNTLQKIPVMEQELEEEIWMKENNKRRGLIWTNDDILL